LRTRIDALDGVGAVTDEVSDGDVLLPALLFHLLEDRLEGLKIGVGCPENSVISSVSNFPLLERESEQDTEANTAGHITGPY